MATHMASCGTAEFYVESRLAVSITANSAERLLYELRQLRVQSLLRGPDARVEGLFECRELRRQRVETRVVLRDRQSLVRHVQQLPHIVAPVRPPPDVTDSEVRVTSRDAVFAVHRRV